MSTIVSDLISYLQCGEAISANDAIYIDSADGKIYKFDVTDTTQTFAGIAKEAGVLDDYIRVVQTGRVKGFTGLTPGVFIYASTTVPGGYQEVEPVDSQKVVLGIAKSATELTVNGGLGIKPGGAGGGGGLDVYYTQDMEGLADVSGFSTGNNAAFLGGGTLQGTLALESVNQIAGTKSLSYTQAAGSLNDYFASELIDIEAKQQNNDSGMTLYFEYDGADDDIKFVVYDVTNGAELTSGVELVKTTGKSTRYALSFYVPVTCTQIRWGAQVLVENIGAVLLIDDLEITSNPFVYKDLVDPRTVVRGAGNGGESITADVTDIPFTEVEDDFGLWDGSTFTADSDGDYLVEGAINASAATNGVVRSFVNGSAYRTLTINDISSSIRTFSGVVTLSAGDVLSTRLTASVTLLNNTVNHHIHIQKIPESTEHVITPAKSTLSDWTAFTPTGSWTTNTSYSGFYRRVGDSAEIQYKVSLSGAPNAATLTVSTPDGLQIDTDRLAGYEIANDGSVLQSGHAVDSGTGRFGLYAAVVNDSTTIIPQIIGTSSTDNHFISGINQTSPITWDSGDEIWLTVSVPILGWSSDATFLAAIPTPKTAYIKDVKPSGTNGGTFTAGAWQTRDLNTLEGDTGFVSLATNQFTLQPGKYEIEIESEASSVDRHKIKLRNITDSSDSIIGKSSFAGSTNTQRTASTATGQIILTSSKTFEVQHQCQTTRSADGFGLASVLGVDEVYTQVKITKVG